MKNPNLSAADIKIMRQMQIYWDEIDGREPNKSLCNMEIKNLLDTFGPETILAMISAHLDKLPHTKEIKIPIQEHWAAPYSLKVSGDIVSLHGRYTLSSPPSQQWMLIGVLDALPNITDMHIVLGIDELIAVITYIPS